jgi:DNA-binding MarR family transcriptional regulator
MATKVSDGVKAVKAATQVTMSNGASTPTLSARVKPLPAKVLRNLKALGEPHRLAVLGYVAAAGSVTLFDVVDHLGCDDPTATSAVNWLKQRGWLASERVPKGGGGGWRYRLSDAGRERLLVLGA